MQIRHSLLGYDKSVSLLLDVQYYLSAVQRSVHYRVKLILVTFSVVCRDEYSLGIWM